MSRLIRCCSTYRYITLCVASWWSVFSYQPVHAITMPTGVSGDWFVGRVKQTNLGATFGSCTGSYSRPGVVVTASHCINSLNGTYRPRFESFQSNGGAAAWVGLGIQHPGYATSNNHDVGLVYLLNSPAAPAGQTFPSWADATDTVAIGNNVTVAGMRGVADGQPANTGTMQVTARGASTYTLRANPSGTQVGDSGGPAFFQFGSTRKIFGTLRGGTTTTDTFISVGGHRSFLDGNGGTGHSRYINRWIGLNDGLWSQNSSWATGSALTTNVSPQTGHVAILDPSSNSDAGRTVTVDFVTPNYDGMLNDVNLVIDTGELRITGQTGVLNGGTITAGTANAGTLNIQHALHNVGTLRTSPHGIIRVGDSLAVPTNPDNYPIAIYNQGNINIVGGALDAPNGKVLNANQMTVATNDVMHFLEYAGGGPTSTLSGHAEVKISRITGTGNFKASGGTLRIGDAGATFGLIGNIEANAGSTLELVGTGTIKGSVSGAGTIQVRGNAGQAFSLGNAAVANAFPLTGVIGVDRSTLTMLESDGIRGSVKLNMTNNATINTTNGISLTSGGHLAGAGKLVGNVTLEGGAHAGAGNSPGLLTIDGDFNQLSNSILFTELGGTTSRSEFDVLDVTGTAFVSGLLDVSLIDIGEGPFVPTFGNTFDILTADTLSGAFSAMNLPSLSSGLAWDIGYLSDIVGTTDVLRLSVVPEPSPGLLSLLIALNLYVLTPRSTVGSARRRSVVD